MRKSSSRKFYLEVRKPTARGAVSQIVVTPRAPDGSRGESTMQLKRNLSRNKALGLAADFLTASGAPPELIEAVKGLQKPDEDDEEGEQLVTADATEPEIQTVERLVARWRRAVGHALEQKAISNSTASTYLQHPENFLAWVKGEFQPGGSGRRRRARNDSARVADPEE
jgi:hypothetical protein